MFQDGGPVPVKRRLEVAYFGTAYSTYGPTPTHRRAVEIAADDFGPISSALEDINDQRLPALREALDSAGVPWTPGRD